MATHIRRAFTLIELLVVIAIIAVLDDGNVVGARAQPPPTEGVPPGSGEGKGGDNGDLEWVAHHRFSFGTGERHPQRWPSKVPMNAK